MFRKCSQSGTLLECKMVLVTQYFAILVCIKKRGVVKLLGVPKMGQMPLSGTLPNVLSSAFVWSSFYTEKVAQYHTKNAGSKCS